MRRRLEVVGKVRAAKGRKEGFTVSSCVSAHSCIVRAGYEEKYLVLRTYQTSLWAVEGQLSDQESSPV